MKKTLTSIIVSILISTGSAYAAVDMDLEPCINGDVSASGSFTSQLKEDNFNLEPCIDGGVSADGMHN